MTANMSLRETFSNKNRRNLNATPAKLPLQASKWQLKSFSSAQFHTLPAKSNSKKLEKSNLKKMEISNFSETEKSNDDMDSRYSPKNGFNSTSLKRIKSMKKSQSDILSILSSGENAIRELDSEFEDSIQKALKNVAEHKNAAEDPMAFDDLMENENSNNLSNNFTFGTSSSEIVISFWFESNCEANFSHIPWSGIISSL